jgi:hypothetical protein
MKKISEKYGVLLESRIFNAENQPDFSRFSGDINPIRLNPVTARKSIVANVLFMEYSAL